MTNKVVSISSHPKYRDLAALRRYLTEGQDHMGTKVDMTRFYDVEDPEIQRQLFELNEWAQALTEIPGLNLSHGANVGKSIPLGNLLDGLLKDRPVDWTAMGAISSPVSYPLNNYTSPTRDVIRITMDNSYKVKGRDDANPDA